MVTRSGNLNTPRTRPLEGPGFVTHLSRSRCDKKREFHKLAVAHSDVRDAHETAAHLLSVVKLHRGAAVGLHAGMDHPLYRPLLGAIIVSYAKPFTHSQGFGVLKKRWTKFSLPKWNECHDRILKARHELYAHSDAEIRYINIQPPGNQRILKGEETVSVGYSIRSYLFTLSEIETIAALTYDLGMRLHAEVERLINELYAGMGLPNREFQLRFNDGL